MENKLSFIRLFFLACVQPRKAVGIVLERDPNYFLWAMVVPYIALTSFSPIYFTGLIKFLPLPLALPLGIFLWGGTGILFFLLLAWIFFRMGKLWGGQGTYKEIRSAYAWSVPAPFLGVPFLLISQIPMWAKVFGGDTNITVILAEPKLWWQVLGSTIFSVMDLWGWVLIFINVAYVHKFGVWKSVVIFLLIVVPLIAGFGIGVKFLNAHLG